MVDLSSHLNRLTVYRRGWNQPVIVDVAGIVATWAVNSPGRLSALAPARGQRITGEDWLGKWVEWEHPTQGRFAGYVEDAPIDTGQGTVEIAVVGHVNILNRRRTKRRARPAMGPPGAIIARTMSDVTLDAGMPFELTVSERGPQMSYEFRAESVMSVFETAVSTSGQEWTSYLDDDRTLRIDWRERVGRDETLRVVFTEGVNVISASVNQTIANTVNDLLAIADDDQYSRAQGARVQSLGSVGRFGRLQDTRQYKGLVTKSTLGPRATRDIALLALPTVTVELRVQQDDPRLVYVRDGTEFRYISAQANAAYRLRALARSVDYDAGVVTLTCDAVRDLTRAAQQDFASYGGIFTQAGA